jgi:hypothetical protein
MTNDPPYYAGSMEPIDVDLSLSQAANDNASPQGQTYRVVVEDDETGQELMGWTGITRARIEAIADFVDNRAVPQEKLGRLVKRRPNLLFGSQARARGRK